MRANRSKNRLLSVTCFKEVGLAVATTSTSLSGRRCTRRKRVGRRLLRRRPVPRLAVLGAAVAALVRRGESGRVPDLVVENPAGRAVGLCQPHPLMFFDDNLGFERVPAFSTVAVLQTVLPADRGRCNSETCSHGAASLDGSNHVGYVSHQKRTIPLLTKQLRR